MPIIPHHLSEFQFGACSKKRFNGLWNFFFEIRQFKTSREKVLVVELWWPRRPLVELNLTRCVVFLRTCRTSQRKEIKTFCCTFVTTSYHKNGWSKKIWSINKSYLSKEGFHSKHKSILIWKDSAKKGSTNRTCFFCLTNSKDVVELLAKFRIYSNSLNFSSDINFFLERVLPLCRKDFRFIAIVWKLSQHWM